MELSVVKIFLVAVFASNVDTVSIAPVNSPVKVNNTCTFVVLPCNFTTPDRPEVTWYRLQDGKKNVVAQTGMDGRHRVSGQFTNRVCFGNKGDLILLKPEDHDSDRYSCEVDVDYDNPTWAKVEMELIVKQHTRPATPMPCVTDRSVSTQHGIGFMIFLDWIVPIVCTVLLVVQSGVQSIFAEGNWRNFLKSRRLVGIVLVVCGFFGLGMVLVFVSILLLADVVCSALETSQHNYLSAGLATGISGNIILILSVFLARLKRKTPCEWISALKSETEASQTDRREVVCEDATETSPKQLLVPSNSDSDNNKTLSLESFLEKGPEINTMQNPSEESVVGLVSTSHKDVYFCTETKIFYKNVERGNEQYQEISTAPSGEYIMLARGKTGIVATTQNRKKKSKVIPLVFIPEGKGKVYNKDVHFKGKRPWICVDPDGDSMYLTDFEGGRVMKTDQNGHINGDIGIGVLKNPVCVVQNQSGSLIVADSCKGDVFVFEKTGNFLTSVKISMPRNQASDMNGCDKIAIGEDGKVFVASPYSKNVLVFFADFRFDQILSTGTETSGLITSLMVVKNSLYVAYGDCIRIYPV